MARAAGVFRLYAVAAVRLGVISGAGVLCGASRLAHTQARAMYVRQPGQVTATNRADDVRVIMATNCAGGQERHRGAWAAAAAWAEDEHDVLS